MSKMSDQFRGLPMKDLIGGPLQAACDAQILLAQASADFIKNVGMVPAVKGKEQDPMAVRTVDFSFNRPTQQQDGSVVNEKVDLQVPLLAIVNTPALSVKEVDVNFTMEVHETVKDHSESSAEATMDAEAKYSFGLFSAKVHVHGSVASKSEHTRQTDNSAKYDVKVVARDDGMPEGLRKVLDMLNTAIAPTNVSTPSSGSGGGKSS
tara:strand:- start:508 stop:1128 length:621 start_codon:yes stop_codon:yes gene_type:complete